MKIFSKFPTISISKHNFWLVICIAKDFIWTTLKMIFSIFRFFFAPSDYRFTNSCISAKYCPIITNHTSMERLFIQLSYEAYISILKNWRLWLVLWSWVTYDIHVVSNCSHYYSLHSAVFCSVLFWLIMFAVQQGGPGEVGPHGPSGPRVSIPPPPPPPPPTDEPHLHQSLIASIAPLHHLYYKNNTRVIEQD